jgi:hypothetical protein
VRGSASTGRQWHRGMIARKETRETEWAELGHLSQKHIGSAGPKGQLGRGSGDGGWSGGCFLGEKMETLLHVSSWRTLVRVGRQRG